MLDDIKPALWEKLYRLIYETNTNKVPSALIYVDQDDNWYHETYTIGSKFFLLRVLILRYSGIKELVCGFDRSAQPGDGTDFEDIYTCYHYRADTKDWTIGTVSYRGGTDIYVEDFNWENKYWTEHCESELQTVANTLSSILTKRNAKTKETWQRPSIKVALLKKWEADFQKLVAQRNAKDEPTWVELMQEVFFCKCWAQEQLRGKFTEQILDQVLTVVEQRGYFTNPWVAAQSVVDSALSGTIEEPGDTLAEKILGELYEIGELSFARLQPET